MDRGTPPQALDNFELWPWERTLDGLILARRDESTRVRYGLYDPDTNRLEAFTFPTDAADLLTQIKSYRLVIATVALFTFLAAFVLAKRPEIKAGRAFPLLLFLAMTLGVGGVVGGSLSSAGQILPYRISPTELGSLGWGVSHSLPERVFSQSHQTLAWLWALLPLAILNFGLAFPDRNPFLKGRDAAKWTLYGIAFLPLLAMLLGGIVPAISPAIQHYIVVAAVAIAAIVWALALGASHERPPDKSGRHAVRWFVAALGLFAGGYVALHAALRGMTGLPEGLARQSLNVFEASCFVLAAWVAPSAMAYSVAARKPQGLGRFLSNFFRHFLMGVPSVLGFLIAWAAAGLVISGSLWAFSPLAILLAVLLAVIAVLPFRGRLRLAIDRRFDRARFHSRERLAAFAQSLPHTVDREALARQLEEEVMKTLRARWCLLFVMDRGTRKLSFQRGKTALSTEARHVTFILDEPLCEYLREE
ncbi:MAG: hypothetical protein L0191_00640, partial [Acidobacteria bacterium]|nr:hypothetical protein [Acidobacteriota bacterium]